MSGDAATDISTSPTELSTGRGGEGLDRDGTAPTELSTSGVREGLVTDGTAPTELSTSGVREGLVSTTTTVRYRQVGPGSTLGRYELGDELGSGGMATVYRARDKELRRDVAVKMLFAHLCKKRDVVARFQREARAVAALDHPHILRVHDVGGGPSAAETSRAGQEPGDPPVEVDPPYIVLELVRGSSLRDFALTHVPIMAEVVAAMGAVMCSALSVAHRAGIIHRDIKPANIMVAEGGRLVLADFGVARVEDEDSSLVTRTGALLGTPAFMSPEQAHGAELDERSDIYSLGATLYQLATGSMPFSGPTPKMMWAISQGERQPALRRNPKIGPDLARVIERMMATSPDQRYADAREAGAALSEVVAAVGLGEPADELADYFAAPGEYEAKHHQAVVEATLALARSQSSRRSLPHAMALADRVLALDPDNQDALALLDTLGRGAGRRGLLLVAGLALVVAALGTLWLLREPAQGSHSPADAAPADAGVADGAAVDGAVVVDDAAVVVVDAAAGPRRERVDARRLRRRADAAVATVIAPVDAAPMPPPPVDAAPAPATITLEMNSWCDVTIDGVGHGRANKRKPITLTPGTHKIVCSQGKGMGEWSKTVRLRAGQHRDLRGDVLRPVRVKVAVKGGDGISLGGVIHKNGTAFELRPDRYRIDIVDAGKKVGGGWVAIPTVGSCTVRDQPALDCYR